MSKYRIRYIYSNCLQVPIKNLLYHRTDGAYSRAWLRNKKNSKTSARTISRCVGTAVQPPGLQSPSECVCVRAKKYLLPGTTHIPQLLPGKSKGHCLLCPRDRGKRAFRQVQTHDGRLAPVTVPTAQAGSREAGERRGSLAQGTGNW